MEIALSQTVSKKIVFYAEILDGSQNGGKMIFGESGTSSEQAHPFEKRVFGHVTSLIG